MRWWVPGFSAVTMMMAVALAPCGARSQTATPPDPAALMLEVEAHEKAAEAAAREYTYTLHEVRRTLNSNGSVKKTTTADSDSFTLDGVRVNKVTTRNGVPLTPDEAAKEDKRIDDQVAKAKASRAKLAGEGKPTDDQGQPILTVERILELGTFSNLRPGDYAGRPVWLVDYAGNPDAKTHNSFEGIVRDLTGTVWIDQADHALVAGHGEFRNDFKVAGGLLVNVHKGFRFDFRQTRVDGVWLPGTIFGEGSLRYLLFFTIDGSLEETASQYRRFRTGITLLPGAEVTRDDAKQP